ncbi:unnamed protein product [Protopolystoma xenopodis]|uniref:Uncharacterized protein n=1 Tax=Protopolystoma xenopodis TaxID=117903 RepID=A0A3S5BGK6_9PLAT|nr:unnamed protein product [Protopolystoma xenopodis]
MLSKFTELLGEAFSTPNSWEDFETESLIPTKCQEDSVDSPELGTSALKERMARLQQHFANCHVPVAIIDAAPNDGHVQVAPALSVANGLAVIRPPYGFNNVTSSNSIVLDKIKHLLLTV